MRTRVVLITGANGEVGRGLIENLAESGEEKILALDLDDITTELRPMVHRAIKGDILDTTLLQRLMSEYEISTIFHLAALLSTRSEFTPDAAHRVNVQGTLNMLDIAIEQSSWRSQSVKFVFPSSIAVYGVPDLETKAQAHPVKEHEFNMPTTMYGCNKLYCEQLGHYYSKYFRQLAATPEPYGVDFRCVRFPGLISAVTVPSGGTSDFVPEMVHRAAQGRSYDCFVRPDARIPFMVMPDAIKSLLQLAAVPRNCIKRHAYNVTSFSLSAEEASRVVREDFPDADIVFNPDLQRQRILDSWPARLDDSAARGDWGWKPDYDLPDAFHGYLAPRLRRRYDEPEEE